jgi:hypothetical protein
VVVDRRPAIEIDVKAYFTELEDIILETLLMYEEDEARDRTEALRGPLDED